MKWITILFILLGPVISKGQVVFRYNQSIPVSSGSNQFNMPWAGGINSAQYNTMDLNDDGLPDLIIFDRTTNRISTFVNQNSSYVYSPDYESVFPDGIRNWMLLRDYNCDGLKDLFTSSNLGIRVFKNLGAIQNVVRWEQAADPVFTMGFNSQINIQMNGSDIPSISDLDNDGDLDILVYDFASGETIEYHKNTSMENFQNCERLDYERITKQWGEFRECFCDDYVFGGADCFGGGRKAHVEGKSILTIDIDGDLDKDLLLGQESCSNISFLQNEGDPSNALMLNAVGNFPVGNPVDFFVFPALYYEDVNFDGTKDLLASPNVPFNFQGRIDFINSSWYYLNQGTDNQPVFNFVERNFLQKEMLDFGEQAAPAPVDIDLDGDLDLVIGNRGIFDGISIVASLALLENKGDVANPEFELTTNDLFTLSQLNKRILKPVFEDYDQDGRTDLILTATESETSATSLLFLRNTSNTGFSVDPAQAQNITVPIEINDNPLFFDENQDGHIDLLIGKLTGSLELYHNDGQNNFSLADPAYLGIQGSPLNRGLNLAVDDLDADGNADMITTDFSGVLKLYPDFLSGNVAPVDALFDNQVTGSQQSFNLGINGFLNTANLFNTDKPVIVVGTGQGGIQILENADARTPPDQTIELTIFPNPIKRGNELKVISNQDVIVRVISLMGKVIADDVFIKKNKTLSLNTNGISPGMYLLHAINNSGMESVYRIAIIN